VLEKTPPVHVSDTGLRIKSVTIPITISSARDVRKRGPKSQKKSNDNVPTTKTTFCMSNGHFHNMSNTPFYDKPTTETPFYVVPTGIPDLDD
ncbi:4907_t:CDS:2, partial [Acaulospora colombiana]